MSERVPVTSVPIRSAVTWEPRFWLSFYGCTPADLMAGEPLTVIENALAKRGLDPDAYIYSLFEIRQEKEIDKALKTPILRRVAVLPPGLGDASPPA